MVGLCDKDRRRVVLLGLRQGSRRDQLHVGGADELDYAEWRAKTNILFTSYALD
jgi:hypothetical protein